MTCSSGVEVGEADSEPVWLLWLLWLLRLRWWLLLVLPLLLWLLVLLFASYQIRIALRAACCTTGAAKEGHLFDIAALVSSLRRMPLNGKNTA